MGLRTKHFYATTKSCTLTAQIEAHRKLDEWLNAYQTVEIISHSISFIKEREFGKSVEYLISVIYKT